MPVLDSSVFTTHYKCCTFSKDLNVILETTDDINLEDLGKFLETYKTEKPPFFQFGSCLIFLFDQKELVLRGYKLENGWIASKNSDHVHKISLPDSFDEIITTLYYFYHISTVV